MFVKLGKQPPKLDKRTLRLATYLSPSLIPPPDIQDNTKGITSWGMMLNDQLGDCTIAGVGHALQVWTINNGTEVTAPDTTIRDFYEKWDGYDPSQTDSYGENPTDQGGVELDVLKNWRNSNFFGHSLLAFATTDPGNVVHIKQSVVLFGGVYIGVSLPATAQGQLNSKAIWDVVENDTSGASDPGSWGGHCVYVPAYDKIGPTCITWGTSISLFFIIHDWGDRGESNSRNRGHNPALYH